MARSQGSICSKDSKVYAQELEILTGLPAKQNLDYIRFLEQLIAYRIAEEVKIKREKLGNKDAHVGPITVEIPLIGMLTIEQEQFHKKHTLTQKPSIHFNYTFKPLNCFKNSVYDAFFEDSVELPKQFAEQYGMQLQNMYNNDELGSDI